jgi:hypothetical protein
MADSEEECQRQLILQFRTITTMIHQFQDSPLKVVNQRLEVAYGIDRDIGSNLNIPKATKSQLKLARGTEHASCQED